MKKLLIFTIYIALTLSFSGCKKDEPVIANFEFKELADGKVEFLNKSTNASTYEWDFGDGSSSKDISPIYTFKDNREFQVNLTARGSSGQNTIPKTVKVTNIYNFSGNWSGKGTTYFTSSPNASPAQSEFKLIFGKRAGNTILITIIERRNNTNYDIFDFTNATVIGTSEVVLNETNYAVDKTTQRKCNGSMILKDKVINLDFVTNSQTAGFNYRATFTRDN